MSNPFTHEGAVIPSDDSRHPLANEKLMVSSDLSSDVVEPYNLEEFEALKATYSQAGIDNRRLIATIDMLTRELRKAVSALYRMADYVKADREQATKLILPDTGINV